jgi:hypothetical protein
LFTIMNILNSSLSRSSGTLVKASSSQIKSADESCDQTKNDSLPAAYACSGHTPKSRVQGIVSPAEEFEGGRSPLDPSVTRALPPGLKARLRTTHYVSAQLQGSRPQLVQPATITPIQDDHTYSKR